MSELATIFSPTLIRASAGSGKTFALSNRFIALLAHGERADKILATTFTRKAAGEILERVYERLSTAALDTKAAAALGAFISKPTFSSAEAQEILKRLTQQQARLNICTLDSFFISVAQSFSFELGLVPGWSLSDSSTDARHIRQSIAKLCSAAQPSDLAELLSLINKGNTKTAIHSQLEREITELYSAWRMTPSSAWDWIEAPKGLTGDELMLVSETIKKLELPLTAKGEPDRNWKNSIADTLSAIEAKDWDTLIEKGICAKLLSGERDFQKRAISEQYQAAFEPLRTHLKAFFLGRLRAQTLASYKFLSLYAKEFEAIRALAQSLNFEGVKHSLAEARVMGELEELYYRLDGRISHLLLDEFQDTSRDEWMVLEPVVAEILSKAQGEQSFFCVGDTKQAIYGWRGGAAQIFETLERSFPILSASVERRDESRRSAPQIIQTVNQVFESLPTLESLSEYPEVIRAWGERFESHTTVHKALPGYAELRCIEKSAEDSEISQDILAEAANLVADLHQESPHASIGVLMRGNEGVSKMLGLLWDRKVRASGEGGNPLTDSWHVNLVLAALRLSEHPGDSISAYLLVNSKLGKHLELKSFTDASMLDAFALKLRTEIGVLGLAEVLRGWVQALSLDASAHDRRRLRQLVELAYAYNYSRASRVSDFIDWVERTPVENPAASSVRVMTIHKSKGLEFDAVVLPELDDRVPKSLPSSLLRLQTNPIAAPTRISRYADRFVRALDPRLSEMHEQAKHREVEEALSVLYVALTRARSQLYMLVEAKPAKSLSFASILREALGKQAASQGILYSLGSKDSLKQAAGLEQASKARGAKEPPSKIKLAASKLGRRRGVVQEVSRKMPGRAVDLAAFMRLDGEESAMRNILFRKLRRSIEWLPVTPLTSKELAEAAHIDLETDRSTAAIVLEFGALLKKPALQSVFTPRESQPVASGKVYHDLPFAFRHEGSIFSGVLPRLVVYSKDSRAVAADIFEFELEDENCEDSMKTRLAARRMQLETYRQAAALFTGLAQNAVRVTLVNLGAAECIALDETQDKSEGTRRG